MYEKQISVDKFLEKFEKNNIKTFIHKEGFGVIHIFLQQKQ